MPFFPSLYNFAHRLTQNRDEAEDLKPTWGRSRALGPYAAMAHKTIQRHSAMRLRWRPPGLRTLHEYPRIRGQVQK